MASMDPLMRFEKITVSGSGSYGTVYCCLDQKTKKVVALKRLKMNIDEGLPATSVREIACLRELSHPNIVKLLNVFHSEGKLTLIFEYIAGGDLDKFIRENSGGPEICGLPLNITKSIARQLLYALAYSHENGVIHRDIKPSNVLIDADTGLIKLCDFGLARQVCIPVKTYSNNVTTLLYRAPEIILGKTDYNSSMDVWSLGILLAECHRGRSLFQARDEIDAFFKLCKIFGKPTMATWPEAFTLPNWQIFEQAVPAIGLLGSDSMLPQLLSGLPPEGVDLITKMCNMDPNKRITCREALKHPFLTSCN